MFTTMRRDYEGSGVTMLFWFDLSHYLHELGFRFMYCRASSAKSMANLVRYGGDMMGSIEGEENGKKLKFWWVRWSMRPIWVVDHYVKQFKLRAKM